jgi:hypothetical protein
MIQETSVLKSEFNAKLNHHFKIPKLKIGKDKSPEDKTI